MISAPELFSLYAELSMALAGFVGVVSAFSGRNRLFQPIERVRLHTVLGCSGSVLAGCFAYLSASAGEHLSAQSLAVAGVAAFAVTAIVQFPATVKVIRHFRDPDSTTEGWVITFVPGVHLLALGLLASAVFTSSAFLLLVSAFSIQLLLGLWVFARLLTRPN
jgi:hypothetical protein